MHYSHMALVADRDAFFFLSPCGTLGGRRVGVCGLQACISQGLRHFRHVFPPTTDRPALPSKPREAAHLPHRWLLKRGSTSQTSLALRPNSAAAASPMHHGRFDDANRNILLRTRYTKLNRTCHAGVVPQPGKNADEKNASANLPGTSPSSRSPSYSNRTMTPKTPYLAPGR